MEVDLRILRDSINRTLDMIIEAKGTTLSIDNDYYWMVWEDELYNIDARPSELVIGDLQYDYERVVGIHKEGDEMQSYLYWHAALLRAISIEYPAVFKDAD